MQDKIMKIVGEAAAAIGVMVVTEAVNSIFSGGGEEENGEEEEAA